MSSQRLDELVAEAYEPKAPDTSKLRLGASGENREWFAELVEWSERELVERPERHGAAREAARHWARWISQNEGPPIIDDSMIEQQALSQLVNERTLESPEKCIEPALDGPGVTTLRASAGAMVLGYLHTGIMSALICGFPYAAGRTVFAPTGKSTNRNFRKTLQTKSSGSRMRITAEQVGVRWVGSESRFEVMRRLLERGEVCALPVDNLGSSEGELLGRPVRTSQAASTLSHLSGAPLIPVAGAWSRDRISVHFLTPLAPRRYNSAGAMQADLLRVIDVWLQENLAQFLARFPGLELAAMMEERKSLEEKGEHARQAERLAIEDLAGAKAAVKRAEEDGLSDGEVARLRRRLRAASATAKILRRERKQSADAIRGIKRKTRR